MCADVEGVNFGVALKAAREEAKMMQADFAKKADLDPSYVSMLENNRKSPTLTVYFRICDVLGLKPSEFMQRVELAPTASPRAPRPRKPRSK